LNPFVSVIIPTRNRSSLVLRSIQSAFAQTLAQIEIIVVVDGSDDLTIQRLGEIPDSRLKVVQHSESRGAAAARNSGVLAATADWIAFLDDDDEWLPQKLELQLEIAKQSTYPFPIISCYLTARTPKGDFVWPRRLPQPNERPGEYLFLRKSFFMGEALILTSTILTKKELLVKIPFQEKLRKNQESDWVLRASQLAGTNVEFAKQTLAIWYREEGRNAISSSEDWQHTLEWAKDIRPLISPEAYASIILVFASNEASNQGDQNAFFFLLKEAFQQGRPTFVPLLLYAANWLIPQPIRRSIRAILMQRRQIINKVQVK
jgi:glycosyltransferase involved in cell wall biosynthesis